MKSDVEAEEAKAELREHVRKAEEAADCAHRQQLRLAEVGRG